MTIDQIFILILSPISIRLLAGKTKRLRTYGCIIGLLSQPFYHWSTFVNDQWGMFIVSIWYTYAFCVGIKNNWSK